MQEGYYFLIPIGVWFVVQILKGIIDVFFAQKIAREETRKEMRKGMKWRNVNHVKKSIIKIFTSSGGFPSGHSALAASVVCLIGLVDGIKSLLFMLALVFSFLWRYDAMHVRYQTGQHAKMLNCLQEHYRKEGIDLSCTKKFRERVGHTFGEVIGGIVIGTVLTVVFYYGFFS